MFITAKQYSLGILIYDALVGRAKSRAAADDIGHRPRATLPARSKSRRETAWAKLVIGPAEGRTRWAHDGPCQITLRDATRLCPPYAIAIALIQPRVVP